MRNSFSFLQIFFSPFRPPRLLFHIGPRRIGVPIFLPRKTVGFDFRDLGWKTKWEATDYRVEYDPVWSFVIFGLQVAVQFYLDCIAWESWLYYTRNTDKTLPTKERVQQMITEFPQTWTNSSGSVDYYPLILKNKYKTNE